MDYLNQSIKLLSIQLNQTSCFQGEFVIGAKALVDDMISAVAARGQNLQYAMDQIFHVRRAGPDINDGAYRFARMEIAMNRAKEAILAAAINPRGADDITSSTRVTYGFLARDLCSAVYIDRSRLNVDRVRRPADGLAVKGILGAEVNHLRVQPAGRRREKSRPLDIDRLSFGGILLGLVD